ncbi:MAG: Holliday junction resolvase RuvX [Ignavibacteriae bacterium]|nr:Holliday junction resolvase RuvX [Ignavibacteriota bacterium]
MAGEPGRVLALDYGAKRVGVAMSDPLRILASGVGTWANDAGLLTAIAKHVQDEMVVLIVVGMPYAPDGGKGAKAREVEAFMERLRGVVQVPLTTWDESYTSVEAHQAFRDGGMKKKQRRDRAAVDTMAARILLQQFLDAQPARQG